MPGVGAPPMRLDGASVDLSPRVFRSATVAGSPATNAETIVASVTVASTAGFGVGVILLGWGTYTVGTDGTSAVFRIRCTDVTGTIIKASGAMNRTAAQLHTDSVIATDTTPTLPGQVYVLTATIAAASAASTFSAVELIAILV